MGLDQVTVTELQVGYLTTPLILSLISNISAFQQHAHLLCTSLHCSENKIGTAHTNNILQRVIHERFGNLRVEVQSMLGFVFCCGLVINLCLRNPY